MNFLKFISRGLIFAKSQKIREIAKFYPRERIAILTFFLKNVKTNLYKLKSQYENRVLPKLAGKKIHNTLGNITSMPCECATLLYLYNCDVFCVSTFYLFSVLSRTSYVNKVTNTFHQGGYFLKMRSQIDLIYL